MCPYLIFRFLYLAYLRKKYLEISANYGNPLSQAGLGVWYQNDEYGEKDYQKALYWLQKSAEQGNEKGQSALADMYSNAWGVKQDYSKAFDLYKNEKEKINKLKLRTLLFSFCMYKNSASDINEYIETETDPDKEEFDFDIFCTF